MEIARSPLDAVLFDLDGVIVSTDEDHYRAWKEMADAEGIYFDRKINERLRGVSRMQSLEIILERAKKLYSQSEKDILAARKNERYRTLIQNLTPDDILPGVPAFLEGVRAAGLKTAIASSSRNTDVILGRIGLVGRFGAVVTGNDIRRSKPDPEVFLLAAQRLGVRPSRCLVVEDAYAGIDAAAAGGMKSLGVGYASGYAKATLHAESLGKTDIQAVLKALG